MFFRFGICCVFFLIASNLSGCSSSEKKVAPSGLDGGGSTSGGGAAVAPSWVEGVFKPSSNYAQRCVNPRKNSEFNDKQGTAMHEKMWLRSMSDELYLWNDQLVDKDPGPFSIKAYFDTLKITSDRFHFTIPTDVYLQGSQSGVYFGYGITWATINDDAHTFGIGEVEGSANLSNEIKRGDELLGADGVYVADAYDENLSEQEHLELIETLNSAISPTQIGEVHVLLLKDRDSGEEKAVTVVAADVVHSPVPQSFDISTNSGDVGYIQFNDHNAASEVALINAITELSRTNVTDLILDIRYNSGGAIYIASMLSYMISGAEHTQGKTFTQLRFNASAGDFDPFTGGAIKPIPFENKSSQGENLPSLNLSRVFVLTGDSTCSASELIMNGLAGVGVEVLQIGNRTCGKPYSFYPLENCGTTYFTVMSENVNAKGFSGYSNGFSANEFNFSADDVFQGCVVNDDFKHDLGDEDEAMLSAALAFRQTGQCPSTSSESKSDRSFNRYNASKIFAPQSRLMKSMSVLDLRVYSP